MLSYSTTRPFAWASAKSKKTVDDAIGLSKSLGDIPVGIGGGGRYSRCVEHAVAELVSSTSMVIETYNLRAILPFRTSSEIACINHSGYLLKRSNNPFRSFSPSNLPLLEQTQEDHGGDESDESAAVRIEVPQHLKVDGKTEVQHQQEGGQHVEMQLPLPAVKRPIETSADILASFFGIQVEDEVEGREVTAVAPYISELIVPTIVAPPLVQRNLTRSAPISFAGDGRHDHHQGAIFRRRDSAPASTQASPPADVLDPKDGHMWRAKYCVLEDGVLYFYRNASDGESPEAQSERLKTALLMEEEDGIQQRGNATSDYNDLAKSPHSRLSGSNHGKNSVIWEKRVALDRVGTVRSAELEHGPYSFELIASAVGDNEEHDRLVLRAQNAEEMNEWLFQFHRSLASFMKNIMDAMGGKWIQESHVMDLYHVPAFQPAIFLPPNTLSPRVKKIPALGASLSHGHGRSGLHRRRASQREEQQFTITNNEASSPVQFSIDQTAFSPDFSREAVEPEVAGVTCPPEMERPPTTPARKYVPPHLRNRKTLDKQEKNSKAYVPPYLRRNGDYERGATEGSFISLAERAKTSADITEAHIYGQAPVLETDRVYGAHEADYSEVLSQTPIMLGGCADPKHAEGSILDPAYKKRMSSRMGKVVPIEAYGSLGGGEICRDASSKAVFRWEAGAVSECGVRSSNEDSFLVCTSACRSFATIPGYESVGEIHWGKHDPGYFAIFDGHHGNEAARFAAERLNQYLYNEWKLHDFSPSLLQHAVENSIANLDNDFCQICTQDGRNWESGSTVIVAAIVDGSLIVSNLGDCRAVICRTSNSRFICELKSDDWTQVDEDEFESQRDGIIQNWFWKEVADVHTPCRADEKRRIEEANGWITTEKEIPIGQLQRMDFRDEDVVEILKRCFSDRWDKRLETTSTSSQKKYSAAPQRILQISRVCGELAVSRAIGDRDFKACFNERHLVLEAGETSADTIWWDCPLPLPYPPNHSCQFKGDLVSAVAESHSMKIFQDDAIRDEFLVLACDGLWDVMDPDDVVRVTRGLLFEKKWPPKKAAERLAELAIHLGSSDNITVIVIRFLFS
jgi:serine/threonine protein phosphatase PrpC